MNWRDYVAAILRCAGNAKDEYDKDLLARHACACVIRVPSTLPSSLEIQSVTPALAQIFLTLGYLQTSHRREALETFAGQLVGVVCAVHALEMWLIGLAAKRTLGFAAPA